MNGASRTCALYLAEGHAAHLGTLRFAGEPGDAIIEVDERSLGPLEMFTEKGLLLRPGQHQVIVKKSGFFTDYHLVQITEDEVTLLEIKLREIPD